MNNLRGNIVPVIDLRLKLGLAATAPTVDTSIVITEVPVDGAPTLLGALADSVQEVIELDAEAISPPPRMGTRIAVDFMRGVARQGEQFLLVLDIDRVMTEDDLRVVTTAAGVTVEQPGDVEAAAPVAPDGQAYASAGP